MDQLIWIKFDTQIYIFLFQYSRFPILQQLASHLPAETSEATLQIENATNDT